MYKPLQRKQNRHEELMHCQGLLASRGYSPGALKYHLKWRQGPLSGGGVFHGALKYHLKWRQGPLSGGGVFHGALKCHSFIRDHTNNRTKKKLIVKMTKLLPFKALFTVFIIMNFFLKEQGIKNFSVTK